MNLAKLATTAFLFILALSAEAYEKPGSSACSRFRTAELRNQCMDATYHNQYVNSETVTNCLSFPKDIQNSCLKAIKENQDINANTIRPCLSFSSNDVQKRCLEVSTGANSDPGFYPIATCTLFESEALQNECLETVKHTPDIDFEEIRHCNYASSKRKVKSCLRNLCLEHTKTGKCKAPEQTASRYDNSNTHRSSRAIR